MLISVLVPSYRRPQDLLRCLVALDQQTRPVDQVVVVIRDTDSDTKRALQAISHLQLPIHVVEVAVPGVVAAMNAGLAASKGDILAVTDDDACPHIDWIERIEKHYLVNENVGGVGGRDFVYHEDILEDGIATQVGKLSWFGRTIGNHHIGIGEAREVDILKGVNMSFRKSAIGDLQFDERMKGTGAQVHLEMGFCLKLRRAGWKLIYDPKVAVNHYPATRFDEDQRKAFNPEAYKNAAHNETVILLEALLPLQRILFILWSFLIGSSQSFGILQAVRFQFSEREVAYKKLFASLKGRWHGWKTWKQT